MEKLLLLIDTRKSRINQHFLCIFSVYLFLRMPLKREFCEIDQNLGNLQEKYTQKLLHLGRMSPNSNPMMPSKIKNNILKAILALWYREWLKQWKHLSFMEMVFVFPVEDF